ncbi:hypothetical protein [Deinococcus maricopensis]|uniref:Periplasmic solute binding protein n=1 Tax=Deinococcus maricopensis (strain DSM 21211 / LMG 22137 / NRRL B-23946 / LB-34) TaxID=709986 RepID=E8U9Z8_DEIML|nr:hypothetical protein [Deinococcus maricopensis]ADV67887.1 periplasmic solute binding protein [Deinococcus maricopensis DSM 21211]
MSDSNRHDLHDGNNDPKTGDKKHQTDHSQERHDHQHDRDGSGAQGSEGNEPHGTDSDSVHP